MELKKFSDINLEDTFFDTLKQDYPEFEGWFQRKSLEGAIAFIQHMPDTMSLQGFLYLKREFGEIDNVVPVLPALTRLKVGTFKIDAHNTKLGERFIKKILDVAIYTNSKEVYVTIYSKHKGLIRLLQRYGFIQKATKPHEGEESELVLVKNMQSMVGDIFLDYPLISLNNKRKFLLSIYPKYHTKLFPDSILKNEERGHYDLIKDVSPTNSIHKVYICFMQDVALLEKGDLLAIYRTNDYQGPAYYRSVVTSICTVEDIRTKGSFLDVKEYIDYTKPYSIFTQDELELWFKKENLVVIKMIYNIAFERKVTRGFMLDNLKISPNLYWGFFRLNDEQFNELLKEGKINENYIIH